MLKDQLFSITSSAWDKRVESLDESYLAKSTILPEAQTCLSVKILLP